MALVILPTADVYEVEDRLLARLERASGRHGKNKKTAGRVTAYGAVLGLTAFGKALPEGVAP